MMMKINITLWRDDDNGDHDDHDDDDDDDRKETSGNKYGVLSVKDR